LRGPEMVALAESPAEKPTDESLPTETRPTVSLDFGPNYLPADTVFVASIKPLETDKGVMAPVFFRFPAVLAFSLSPRKSKESLELEEVKVIVTRSMLKKCPESVPMMIFRTKDPYDWSKLRTRLLGEF